MDQTSSDWITFLQNNIMIKNSGLERKEIMPTLSFCEIVEPTQALVSNVARWWDKIESIKLFIMMDFTMKKFLQQKSISVSCVE